MYERDPHSREANRLVDEWIKHYEACSSLAEKRQKVWELGFGVAKVRRMNMDQPTFPAGLLEAIKPRIGATVHYIIPTSGHHRPAVIVEVFGDRPDGLCNLQVFTDGTNDGFHSDKGTLWATSIHRDDTMTRHGTWHWPEGTREALSIAHVRERTMYEQSTTESTKASPGADEPPTIKTEALTSTFDADEEAVTAKAPAVVAKKK